MPFISNDKIIFESLDDERDFDGNPMWVEAADAIEEPEGDPRNLDIYERFYDDQNIITPYFFPEEDIEYDEVDPSTVDYPVDLRVSYDPNKYFEFYDYLVNNNKSLLYEVPKELQNLVKENYLGDIFTSGSGVCRDFKEAFKHYKLAADSNYAIAQFHLGEAYYNGFGVNQDYKEAIKYYRQAADNGCSSAMNAIGDALYYGIGIKQNRTLAFYCYTKAMEQGNLQAIRKLQVDYHMIVEDKYLFYEEVEEIKHIKYLFDYISAELIFSNEGKDDFIKSHQVLKLLKDYFDNKKYLEHFNLIKAHPTLSYLSSKLLTQEQLKDLFGKVESKKELKVDECKLTDLLDNSELLETMEDQLIIGDYN